VYISQAVIDYNIIPQLIQMLETEDFDIRKECAWAISNATSGGDDMQIKYLVDQVNRFLSLPTFIL
jgi:importin subunit alpha-1